jgi:hypothetical protein
LDPSEVASKRKAAEEEEDDDVDPECLMQMLPHELLATYVVPAILAALDPSADRPWVRSEHNVDDGRFGCQGYHHGPMLDRELRHLRTALEALAPRDGDYVNEDDVEDDWEGGVLPLNAQGARRAESCKDAFTAAAVKLAELLRSAPRERLTVLNVLHTPILVQQPELGCLAVPALKVAGSPRWSRAATVADVIDIFTTARPRAIVKDAPAAPAPALGSTAYYVCVDGAGVGFRSTMDMGDRWGTEAGVRAGDVVVGTLEHADWLLERTSGKYLPIRKVGVGELFRQVDEARGKAVVASKAKAAEAAAMPAAERVAKERALLRRLTVERELTAGEEVWRKAFEKAWYERYGDRDAVISDAYKALESLKAPVGGESRPLREKYVGSFVAQLTGPSGWNAANHYFAQRTLRTMDGVALSPFVGELLPLIQWRYACNPMWPPPAALCDDPLQPHVRLQVRRQSLSRFGRPVEGGRALPQRGRRRRGCEGVCGGARGARCRCLSVDSS